MTVKQGRGGPIVLAIWLFCWVAITLGVPIPAVIMAIIAVFAGVLLLIGY